MKNELLHLRVQQALNLLQEVEQALEDAIPVSSESKATPSQEVMHTDLTLVEETMDYRGWSSEDKLRFMAKHIDFSLYQ